MFFRFFFFLILEMETGDDPFQLLTSKEFFKRRRNLVDHQLQAYFTQTKTFDLDKKETFYFLIVGGFETSIAQYFIQEAPFLYLTGLSLPGLILLIKVTNILAVKNPADPLSSFSFVLTETIFIPEFQSQLVPENWAKLLNQKLLPDYRFQKAGKKTSTSYLSTSLDLSNYEYFIRFLLELLQRPEEASFYANISEKEGSMSSTFLKDLVHRYRFEKRVQSCSSTINFLRQNKTVAERYCLKKAVEISENAHLRFKQDLKEKKVHSSKTDLDIEGEFVAYFKSHDTIPSYAPIVLSGPYGEELHGNAEGIPIFKFPLLLCDVACSYFGYKADLTRTYSTAQLDFQTLEIFSILEKALLFISQQAKPGVFINERHPQRKKLNLNDLYILWINKLKVPTKEKQKYFRHSVGHHIGLETHDPEFGPLEIGNIIALEIGYYSSTINIRLENCYEIVKDGSVVLNNKI